METQIEMLGKIHLALVILVVLKSIEVFIVPFFRTTVMLSNEYSMLSLLSRLANAAEHIAVKREGVKP